MSIYESIELTEEEVKAAILEGKKKKYFHEKNKDYWASLEKGKTKVTAYQFGTQKTECSDPSASPAPGHGFRA